MSDALLPKGFADLRHLGEWIVPTEEGRHKKKIAADIETARRFYATVFPRMEAIIQYSAQCAPGPRDFEADHRPVRPAARQFRRRRRAAESGRRSARPDVAPGQRDPRPAPSRQGGAPAPGPAAAACLRAGLWLRRLQRRRAAGRRPDPQAVARAPSAP